MDKHTLSQYGWVVSVILVLAIMISLSTPFASVLSNGFKGAVSHFKDTSSGVLDNMGGADNFGDLCGGASGGDHGMGEGGPVMLEGQGQSFHQFAPTALTFRSNADIDEFQEVQVNGETVDPMYYEVSEGSTVITLSMEYLATLESDKHLVSIVSNTGSATTEFEVVKPETNEHGFYYNQPYSAEVSGWGKVVFFIREDGTYDLINGYGVATTNTYTVDGDSIVALDDNFGAFHCTILSNGTEIYCAEVQTSLKLSNDTSFAADDDYFYVYKEELGGYEVKAIDTTKAEYADIKTGINGIPTVKLADNMFANYVGWELRVNNTLVAVPCIPSDVTTIGKNAFIGCENLTSVTIPDSVTTIDDHAFYYCRGLTNVVLSDGLISIGQQAFSDCVSLTSVIIPDSVTNCSCDVFSGCSNLINITFEGTMAQWKDIGVNWFDGTIPATEVQCSDGVVSWS